MNKKCIWVLCVMAVFIITMKYFIKPNSEEDVPMAPDVVSSISMNRDQYLTVVANRDNIILKIKKSLQNYCLRCVRKILFIQLNFLQTKDM